MTRKYEKYTCQFKHDVLQEYRPGIYGYGFKALAKRFKIKGGHKLIMSCYRRWKGGVDSLKPTSKGCRSHTMTRQQVRHYILEFVGLMNNKYVAVDYNVSQEHIESVLKRKVPIRTIRRYGKECGITWKKPSEITSRDDTQPTAYAKRYDFVGAINGSQSIACMTLTPEDRNKWRIKGVRQRVINKWITDTLAPAINRLNIDNIYLICDKSRAHNKANMIQALRAGKCKSVKKILYMPTASAIYVSPLDNPLWYSFKNEFEINIHYV
ncbi:unnamed protein product [Rotaria sordida]|uniref:Uncharacterized protein n=2 Tax=Rotaria sordida TaxID=392033 RepID=A0A815W1S0_9BILA|nr:unnamed protein product [Rotaria sordida]